MHPDIIGRNQTKIQQEQKQFGSMPKKWIPISSIYVTSTRILLFFAGYHWFFSLIVGRRSTMNCPNCPSSLVFYDQPKWEIYAFYTKTDKSLVTLLKKRDSRFIHENTAAVCEKRVHRKLREMCKNIIK